MILKNVTDRELKVKAHDGHRGVLDIKPGRGSRELTEKRHYGYHKDDTAHENPIIKSQFVGAVVPPGAEVEVADWLALPRRGDDGARRPSVLEDMTMCPKFGVGDHVCPSFSEEGRHVSFVPVDQSDISRWERVPTDAEWDLYRYAGRPAKLGHKAVEQQELADEKEAIRREREELRAMVASLKEAETDKKPSARK